MIDDRYVSTAELNVTESHGLLTTRDLLSREKYFNYRLDVLRESIRLYLIDNPTAHSFDLRFGEDVYSVGFSREDKEVRVLQQPTWGVWGVVGKELDGNKLVFNICK